jgi:CheY-like chemotaxis protein
MLRSYDTLLDASWRARPPVLVVDDNEDMRELVGTILDSAGYPIAEAGHGEAALSYLRSAPILPGLVLLDLEMPVMDGWSFIARMRAVEEFAEIPILLISGADARAMPRRIPRLIKPVDARTLLAAVAQHYAIGHELLVYS